MNPPDPADDRNAVPAGDDSSGIRKAAPARPSRRKAPARPRAAEEENPGYRLLICDIAEGERPRERFMQVGASGMSQRELLAILLRHGPPGDGVMVMADRLLREFGGLAGLARASVQELQRVRGVGQVKAIEIKAALELGRRMIYSTPDQRPQIRTPADAAQLLMPEMSLLEQEEVRTLQLDTRNRVMSTTMVYRGSLNAATMRIGELFKEAIRGNCASIIVAHNHPSGDATPSSEDVRATRSMVEAGKLLDVEVLDHLVIGHNTYVSLKERGLGFE